MPHLKPAQHETSKHDSPNKTKVKEKQNKTIPDSNSNIAKSMTHHNQTKELTTWFLKQGSEFFNTRLDRKARVLGSNLRYHGRLGQFTLMTYY
jgi:hypothetical protein